MKKLGYVSLLSVGCTLSACGYVPVQPQAEQVLILPRSRTADCRYVGKTQVSVSTKFRLPSAVESDLRNVAKNQTAEAGGDTATPLGQAAKGNQTFAMYKCMSASTKGRNRRENSRRKKNGVQTHPYHPPAEH